MKKFLLFSALSAILAFGGAVESRDPNSGELQSVGGLVASKQITVSNVAHGSDVTGLTGNIVTSYSKNAKNNVGQLTVNTGRVLTNAEMKTIATSAATGVTVAFSDKTAKDGTSSTVVKFKDYGSKPAAIADPKFSASTVAVANGLSDTSVTALTQTKYFKNPSTGQTVEKVETTMQSKLTAGAADIIGASDKNYKFKTSAKADGSEVITTSIKTSGELDAAKVAALKTKLGAGWDVAASSTINKAGAKVTTYKLSKTK